MDLRLAWNMELCCNRFRVSFLGFLVYHKVADDVRNLQRAHCYLLLLLRNRNERRSCRVGACAIWCRPRSKGGGYEREGVTLRFSIFHPGCLDHLPTKRSIPQLSWVGN